MVIEIIGGERPVGQRQVGRQFDKLVAGMQAPVIAVAVVDLAIGVHAARRLAQRHRGAELAGEVAPGIAAIAGGDLAAQRVLGTGGLGQEVDQPAHLARSIDRRWRPAQDLDPRRVGQRRGVGAAILGPLETAEIILRQRAAQRHRAFDAVIAGGIGRGGDRCQPIDAGDAIAGDGGVADQGDGAGRLDQRLLQAEGGAVGAHIQQTHGIAGNGDLFDSLSLSLGLILGRGLGLGRSRRQQARCYQCGQNRKDQTPRHGRLHRCPSRNVM
jgi:hypothetical protein